LTTGEVTDRFSVLFVPAAYVFLIWSLIYLALIIFAVYIVTKRGLVNEKIDTITWWFVASNIFNALRMIFWHYEQFPITMVVMVGLLISLIVIYLKLGIGKKERKLVEKLVVSTPFSIYLGWITVATVGNTGNLL
jgi:tryptophan-rich sensory protein